MIRLLATFLLLAPAVVAKENSPYDPLKVSETAITALTFDIPNATRDRSLPVRVYLPESAKPAPVILLAPVPLRSAIPPRHLAASGFPACC